MAGVNKVILIGHLGKDPQVTTFESGFKKATFSLATSERVLDKENKWTDHTEWHNIVLWRKSGDVNLLKGDLIYLEGRLRTRQYQDKNGVTKYFHEILADKVTKLSTKKESMAAAPPHVDETPPVLSAEEMELPSDDLPF